MADEYVIDHAVIEVIRDGDPDVRIDHALIEVIRDGDPDVRIDHALIEVIRNAEAEPTANSSFFLFF